MWRVLLVAFLANSFLLAKNKEIIFEGDVGILPITEADDKTNTDNEDKTTISPTTEDDANTTDDDIKTTNIPMTTDDENVEDNITTIPTTTEEDKTTISSTTEDDANTTDDVIKTTNIPMTTDDENNEDNITTAIPTTTEGGDDDYADCSDEDDETVTTTICPNIPEDDWGDTEEDDNDSDESDSEYDENGDYDDTTTTTIKSTTSVEDPGDNTDEDDNESDESGSAYDENEDCGDTITTTIKPTTSVEDLGDNTDEDDNDSDDSDSEYDENGDYDDTTTTTIKSTTSVEGCRGDANATRGCDKECKMRCPGSESSNCKCPENSCKCIKEYLYDLQTNKCLKLKDCSKHRGYNTDDDDSDSDELDSEYDESGDYDDTETTTTKPTTAVEAITTTEAITEMTTTERIQEECPDALYRFKMALLAYQAKFFSLYISKFPNESFCGSILTVLSSLLLFSSSGVTYIELSNLLGLKYNDEMRCVARTVSKYFHDSQSSYIAGIAIFANKEYQFTEKVKRDIMENVMGKAKNVNFGKPGSATDYINTEMAKLTNNLTAEIIPSYKIFDQFTQMVLTNGVFIKPVWKFRFDSILKQKFFNGTKWVLTDFMTQKGSIIYNYAKSIVLNAEVYEIPLSDNDYSMVLYQPMYPFRENELIKKLGDPKICDSVYTKLKPTLFYYVQIPIIDTSTLIDIVYWFNKTDAAPSLLRGSTAELHNTFVDGKRAGLTNGFQNCTFETTTEGGPVINADVIFNFFQRRLILIKPFFYSIMYKKNNEYFPLLFGKYANNESKS